MKRLYFVAEDVDTCERVAEALHSEGIREGNFHVLAKDETGLYQHHVRSATTYQQLDVIHTGERWGLVGAGVGLAVGLVAWFTQALPWGVEPFTVVLMAMVGGLFGAWQGGMVGLSRENYKIAPYHEDIEAGRYLIMVDVDGGDRSRVREIMNMGFPEVRYRGRDSTFINPLASAQRIYHQSTH